MSEELLMGGLEILIQKVDQMATLQAQTLEQQNVLTKAVITLTVQIEHFEKLRSEHNIRMDRLEKMLQDQKEEAHNREEKISERLKNEVKRVDDQHRTDTQNLWTAINGVVSRVDQIKPIVGIVTMLFIAAIVFAFGFKS